MSNKVKPITLPHDTFPFYPSPAAAGFSSPAQDETPLSLNLHELLIKHPSATFFMQVEGNSMIDANVYSGDIVIVDRALTPYHGSMVIAIVHNELVIKTLERKGKQWFLVSANSAYEPIAITDEFEAAIWGIVTFIIHKVKAS